MRSPRDENGAVAVLMALSMTILLVVAALVLDFGLARVDRQVDKSAADAATVAGLHALNAGDGKPHPFIGVCAAVQYLQKNNARFEGVTADTGSWSTGTGSVVSNGCTDLTLRSKTCIPGSEDSWARFTWTGTWSGEPLSVTIQSGYALHPATGWVEDTLPAAKADVEDKGQGCNHLAVITEQSRQPGFGSLATTADLDIAVRSVGRVKLGSGGYAPAMLLLKQSGCPVLQAPTGGTASIHVIGAVTASGKSQPGTIHSDSDAEGGCSGGSNQNLYLGRASSGIVAFAAPLIGNPTQPDPTKPGQITSVAGANGKAANFVRDAPANVYSSGALNSAGAGAATKTEPIGRSRVTRAPVDERYRVTAKLAMQQAHGVFAAGSSGYLKFPGAVDACKPTQAQVNALGLTPTSRLYVDCTTNSGFAGPGTSLTIGAGTVFFAGKVAPSALLSLPNAHHVYIGGSSAEGLSLGGGGNFAMNTASNLDPVTNRCSNVRSSRKAVLFVKDGAINESNGSLLQLCKTTVFLMGGGADGCVPDTDGTAPTASPCNGALGSGRISQSGGDIDWTAPDAHDAMDLPSGDPDPTKAPLWADTNGPEDLALWSESGSNSSSNFRMGGGGVFNVRGVFVVPNADPFTIGGNSSMNLANAQFIASSIALNGTNTNITMSVDPNSAVTLPRVRVVGLVR